MAAPVPAPSTAPTAAPRPPPIAPPRMAPAAPPTIAPPIASCAAACRGGIRIARASRAMRANLVISLILQSGRLFLPRFAAQTVKGQARRPANLHSKAIISRRFFVGRRRWNVCASARLLVGHFAIEAGHVGHLHHRSRLTAGGHRRPPWRRLHVLRSLPPLQPARWPALSQRARGQARRAPHRLWRRAAGCVITVMAGLDPAIHVLALSKRERKTWITGTSPV